VEYSFARYLLSKETVDERALNQHVYNELAASLPARALKIIEVGAGIATMPVRLLRRGLLSQADYIMVDESAENIAFALDLLPHRVAKLGLRVERSAPDTLRAFDDTREVLIHFQQADVFDFIRGEPPKADLLIASAFLDLLPMPVSLFKLFLLLKPGGLAWLTLNFDGVTTLEPALDPELDARIERLYHLSMDTRRGGGDSLTGRHLFAHLRSAGAQILAAGGSDWVVLAQNGHYPADEAYFLKSILHFFEESLTGNPEVDGAAFAGWLAKRQAQVERGELVYIAHQIDFLVRV
jgi:hypothetical protein